MSDPVTISLTGLQAAAMREIERGNYVSRSAVRALVRRGLVDERGALTEAGQQWCAAAKCTTITHEATSIDADIIGPTEKP